MFLEEIQHRMHLLDFCKCSNSLVGSLKFIDLAFMEILVHFMVLFGVHGGIPDKACKLINVECPWTILFLRSSVIWGHAKNKGHTFTILTQNGV